MSVCVKCYGIYTIDNMSCLITKCELSPILSRNFWRNRRRRKGFTSCAIIICIIVADLRNWRKYILIACENRTFFRSGYGKRSLMLRQRTGTRTCSRDSRPIDGVCKGMLVQTTHKFTIITNNFINYSFIIRMVYCYFINAFNHFRR